ncbi:MAG TPA: carboxypeptidase regulatory-like domain-containing protein [Gemmatimonadales bacterium]|nr:carboxypeptidase regulatory-like domain-containing protein [Gemmatimonadales bacterium]
MTARLGSRSSPWLLASLLVVSAARSAATQVGTTTDIITGTVTGPDSQPLAAASVEVISVETQVSRQRTTDAHGRFTIVFPDGGGRYQVVVRFIGMAATRLDVVRQADEDRLVVNVHMGVRSVPLEPLTVTAQRNARSERAGPGATERSLNPEQLARLPIDASDLNAVATLAPGVLGIAGSDSTATAFSVAGQRPTANNVTLDGASFSSGSVPQDAVRSTRVVTSSYDVARGQFSGGVVASTTRSGTNVPQGSFTYALRDRDLAWGEATSSPFGQGATQNQLSGGMGGPIIPNKLFVFGALQGRWRGQALPSLASADAATLERLGVSPDSAARFLALARASGAPMTISGIPGDRIGDNTLALLRLDWRPADAHTFTLRLDGRWDSQEPVRVGTLALPATGGTRTERAGGVMAALTSYFGGSFINELRGYVAATRRDARPFLALPAALVVVTSDLQTTGQGVATLAFGGNDGLPQRTDNRSVEASEELSWLPGNTAHRVKLGAYLNGTRVAENQTPNQLGTFVFPSLQALAADSAALFMRTIAPLERSGTAWNSAVYAGDTWRVGRGLQLTYGVRFESARFSAALPYNRAVDSLFALRTDRVPSEVHLSPRIGFTWAFGGGADQTATFLRGGVGDFRSLTPTSLYSAVLDAPGLSDAETQLICIGPAVPIPDWSQYAQDPSTIPSQCVDTATTVTITPRPNVTVFAPDYAAPRARRASLAYLRRFHGNDWVSVEASYARGVHQYGFRDMNLVTTPRFTLSDEADRPVYVPADSIVPATGALSSTASRIHPEFGQVLQIGSDLQSSTQQLTLGFIAVTKRGAVVRLSYTLTRARDQSSYSCCSTARGFAAPTTGGDPNTLEWATSDLERRHSFLGTVTYPIITGLEVSAIGRLTSGAPFTPIVGADINGDGARNDRAFIFEPASTVDTGVAHGMQMLLDGAPASVRHCLRNQLERIAARNSCTGPWQPSLDLQLNWRPAWFGPDRRLTMSVLTVNLLGGIDEWLHGAAGLHGWGYATAPDPVLLSVRGFDPTSNRYLYAVNGRFGATASANGGVAVPFQVGVQARYALGPGPARDRLRTSSARRQAGTEGGPVPEMAPAGPTAADPAGAILLLRDSLNLSSEQVAQLQAIADSLGARQRTFSDSSEAQAQRAPNLRWALERVRQVLTPEQWSKVPDPLKSPGVLPDR